MTTGNDHRQRLADIYRYHAERAADTNTYEVYRQIFHITEWRDGCVFRTQAGAICWFPQSVVDANVPAKTNIVYAAPPDVDFLTIKLRKQ